MTAMTRLAATAADNAVPTAKPPKKFFQDSRADANHDGRGAETFAAGTDSAASMRLCKCLVHGAERFEFLGASGASRHMSLDVAGVTGIELAVDERMQHDFGVGAVHGVAPSATVQAERSIARAR